jgi:hypothetical protein
MHINAIQCRVYYRSTKKIKHSYRGWYEFTYMTLYVQIQKAIGLVQPQFTTVQLYRVL